MKQYKSLITKVTASISIIGSGILINHLVNKEELKASWTNTYEPSVKWDFNWDRRDTISSVKRHRHHSSSSLNQNNDQNKANNNENNTINQNKPVDDFDLNKQTSKATRHLFLIRHGQYEIKAPIADQMILTTLGREQAELTGKRLSELRNRFKFNKLHHSTMIRAIETAQLIHKELNLSGLELPVSVDPLLCEGN
jgi:serine/threonine-protein phosphatase PGAM5